MQHDVAFHLIHVTFPLIKDPKLLLGITQNILNSYEAAIETILKYERSLNLIPPFNDNFQGKMNVFIHKVASRHNLSQDYLDLILSLKDIIDAQKKSPIDFSRKKKFVICTGDYDLKTITLRELKGHLQKNKEFLSFMEKIITENLTEKNK